MLIRGIKFFPRNKHLLEVEMSAAPSAISLPAYNVNYTGGAFLASLQVNSSRSHLLTILTHTTVHPAAGQNSGQGSKGSLSDTGETDDSFGEHYFHICIYIWACVVISSLIALSVKWGCCGRSLTRWEVKRIPLKRFQRVEGEDSQDKCPICHEEFHEERLIRQLPCNHCYHSYCVDRWLVKMSNRCPLCKQRVSISLLCPWNKQRRKKGININLASDMEASVDDSPPLPPLATLTPSNWYGEEIMSGPSRFIIMRPGKPTRVIDIREKKKPPASPKISPKTDVRTFQPVSTVRYSSQNFDEIVTEQNFDLKVGEVSSVHSATENGIISIRNSFQDDDIVEHEQIQAASAYSSRRCSVTSDQPLLFHNHCTFGEGNEGEDLDERLQNCESFKSSPAVPLLRPDEVSKYAQCCDDPLNRKGFDEADEIKMTPASVKLSSRSESFVPCNLRTEDTKPKIATPSSNSTLIISKNSASLATLDCCRCMPDCRYPVPAHYNKRHTLPGNVTESWVLHEFIPSNVPHKCIHRELVKPTAPSKTTNSS